MSAKLLRDFNRTQIKIVLLFQRLVYLVVLIWIRVVDSGGVGGGGRHPEIQWTGPVLGNWLVSPADF